jgi:hypothetical protein
LLDPIPLKDMLERRKDVGEDASFFPESAGETATPVGKGGGGFGQELAEKAREGLGDGEERDRRLDLVYGKGEGQ